MERHDTEHGQSTPELLALLPLVAVLVAVGWQVAAGAYTWVAATDAARSAARADAVDAPVDPAVRAVVPAGSGARVLAAGDHYRVRLTPPRLFGGAPMPSIDGAPVARIGTGQAQ